MKLGCLEIEMLQATYSHHKAEIVRISFVQPLHKGDYCKSLYIASRAILFLLANGENTYNRGCNEILVKSIYGGFEKKIVPH